MNDGIALGRATRRLICAALVLLTFTIVAPAASQALGITANQITQPKKLAVGKSKVFKANLHYDNTIGVAPVPSEVGLNVEIPKGICYQPTLVGYSDKPGMYEMSAADAQSGNAVWQYRSKKWIFTPSDMYIELSVKGKKSGNKNSYMGTRPFSSSSDAAEYNSTKALTVS